MFFKQKDHQNNSNVEVELAHMKQFRSAIDNAMARIEFTKDGIILDCNANFESATGYRKAEIIGQHHRIFCHDATIASHEYTTLWSDLGAGRHFSGKVKRKNKNGDTFWLEAIYSPILDENGNVVKVVKLASDVTEQVFKEQEAASKLEALDRSSAVIEFTPQGHILDCNENFLNTVKYSKPELIGNHHRMFCDQNYASSAEYAGFWDSLRAGQHLTGNFERFDKHGNSVWIRATYHPVYNRDGELVKIIKYAQDITDSMARSANGLVKANDALQVSDQTAEVANESTQLISNTIEEMGALSTIVNESSAHITTLSEQSSQIGTIINTIKGIADQTNLLALNASIEAARAGEHGRGFAVVADEVRSLSMRTSEATAEISNVINTIQGSVDNAADKMSESLTKVKMSEELASKASNVSQQIRASFGELSEAMKEVTESLSE